MARKNAVGGRKLLFEPIMEFTSAVRRAIQYSKTMKDTLESSTQCEPTASKSSCQITRRTFH